jgi:hypothetical protein
VTKALPELSPLPRLKHWLPDNGEYAVCPVLKPRSQSKTKTLGDSTFWRQVSRDQPTLAQRTVLDADALAKLKIADGGALHAHLQRMGIQSAKIPSRDALQNWINAATPASKEDKDTPLPPLKLSDGTPVKSLWKFDSKGSLSAPMGWSGKRNADGTLRELRSISLRFDRVELWLGYDHDRADKARIVAGKEQRKALKEGRAADAALLAKAELAGWVYQRRLIPDSGALRHLKQLGFSFGRDKRRKAPPFMQAHPDRPEGHRSIRDLVLGGRLFPFSAKVGQLRKGDVFRLGITKAGDIITDGSAPYWSSWFRVSATGEDIELKNVIFKEAKDTSLPLGFSNNVLTQKKRNAQVLAAIAGLPVAAVEAVRRGLRIPPPPPRPASPGGENGSQTSLKL